ncbi:unnamed protein product, partial [Sphacelaria rigidula]
VQVAHEGAKERVRGEFESLQSQLEQLYRKSLDDLDAHKAVLEEPTKDCLKVLDRQRDAIREAEEKLKEILGDPDEERCVT